MTKDDIKKRVSLLTHVPAPFDFPKARLDVGSGKLQKESKGPVTQFEHAVIIIEACTTWKRVVEVKRAFRPNNLIMLGQPEELRRLLLRRFEIANVTVLAVTDPIACGMFSSVEACYHTLDLPAMSPDAALRLDIENPTSKDISLAVWLTGNVREEVTS
jgi:hypothetical protein